MSVPRIQSSSLRCKNDCGFYGNPSWNGYCSVCYRETYLQHSLSRNLTANITSVSSQAFSKFEAKRKQLAGKGANTLKNIFRFTKDGLRDKSSNLPEECYNAADAFNTFLGTLKGTVSADVSRLISKLLEELETMGGSHIDQYSLVIQNFYQNMAERISKSPLYSGLVQSTSDKLMSAIERFLTTWIYCWAFASPITDDESVDLKLQEKIRSLHWITPPLLDSPINPRSPAELAALDNATFALIRVNALYASEDKLDQITECCLHVFEALKQHYEEQHQQGALMKVDKFAGSPNALQQTPANEAVAQPVEPNLSCNTTGTPTRANADDFLPTLIWVVVKANPPLLHSNLQFIMRFANQKRLNSGQAGYFFTNLSCAVHFLTNLTHESLNMTEQEFYRCMRTGIPLNRRSGKQCEGEQLLTDNEIRLLDLEERFTDFEKQLDSMEKDMKQFDMLTKEQISRLRTNYPVDSLADKLDPRQLENPFVLLLGPPPVLQQPDESVLGLPPTSLLDLEDESTAGLLPSPIEPSPYVPTSHASSASKPPS
ncbi:hypothetical protein CRM22_000114 [Opisthorchis felineus]|uniref:Rab5 GDP/GTP exchange factor n=1 Tax=Opisthorchis felineus TaxID=147828 RepID=A0A4S2MGB6_OPIFE|nr:hypothetical protein CRM22_000114 [Opisthorchis felineus]